MKEDDKKQQIQEELQEQAPLLAQLKQGTASSSKDDVPPRYFKELPEQLWLRIQSEEQASAPTYWQELLEQIRFWLQPRPAIGFAVLILLLGGLWFFWPSNENATSLAQQNSMDRLEEIPDEALYEYVLDNIGNYETADFAELAPSLSTDGWLPFEAPNQELDAIMEEYLEQVDDINLEELL